MERVYICSPLRGNETENIRLAKIYSEYAIKKCNVLPVTPHIYFTLFLKDDIEIERNLGIKAGLELLSLCQQLWYFGECITEGMAAEIIKARELGIKVRHVELEELLINKELLSGGISYV